MVRFDAGGARLPQSDVTSQHPIPSSHPGRHDVRRQRTHAERGAPSSGAASQFAAGFRHHSARDCLAVSAFRRTSRAALGEFARAYHAAHRFAASLATRARHAPVTEGNPSGAPWVGEARQPIPGLGVSMQKPTQSLARRRQLEERARVMRASPSWPEQVLFRAVRSARAVRAACAWPAMLARESSATGTQHQISHVCAEGC